MICYCSPFLFCTAFGAVTGHEEIDNVFLRRQSEVWRDDPWATFNTLCAVESNRTSKRASMYSRRLSSAEVAGCSCGGEVEPSPSTNHAVNNFRTVRCAPAMASTVSYSVLTCECRAVTTSVSNTISSIHHHTCPVYRQKTCAHVLPPSLFIFRVRY